MGYGLIDVSGSSLQYLSCGVIKASRSAPIEQRLLEVYQGLLAVLQEWRPHVVALEEPFLPRSTSGDNGYQTSVRSAIAVGQAQGAALMAAAQRRVPVVRYAPSQIKRAVSEYGRGSKEQVQEMVRLLLGLDSRPEPSDAADALAVAICHAQQLRVRTLTALGEA